MMAAPSNAVPATPAQIARNGHVAAALRAFGKENGWSPGDFNKRLGRPQDHTSIYVWLTAKGAPGPKARAKLAKATGLSEVQLIPRKVDGAGGKPSAAAVATAAKAMVSSRGGVPAVIAVSERPRPATDVLSFVVSADGTTRTRLDVSLPLEQGSALLRMLLDMGLVLSAAP
jgi:hypothetical protein